MVSKKQSPITDQNKKLGKCEECAGQFLITNSVMGTICCQTCGLVQSARIIDESAEWRSFGESNDGKTDMNRVGGKVNPYLSNLGIETNVKGNNANLYSKWLSKGNMTMSSKDSSMMRGMSFLRELCDRLAIIDKTYDKACEILKKVDDAECARM